MYMYIHVLHSTLYIIHSRSLLFQIGLRPDAIQISKVQTFELVNIIRVMAIGTCTICLKCIHASLNFLIYAQSLEPC